MSYDTATDASGQQCRACSSLLDRESAFQKFGREENNTHLPPAAACLKVVRDYRPHGNRKLQLQQCPECGTCFLYKTDYEYLVDGSEDEEFLTRLTDEQAAEYLNRSAPD